MELTRKVSRKIATIGQGIFIKKRIHGLMRPYDTIVPTHLAIETTNLCNGKCVFCPSNSLTRDRGVMGMELFKKIIDDANTIGSVEFITHGGMGEPLMDDFLAEKIAIEKSLLDVRVQLHTNGSLLNEDNILKLFTSKLDVLSISLNAFHSTTHKNTTDLDYETVRQNVETAFKRKKKLKAKTQIRITMVRTKDMSQEEVNNFQNYWRRFTPNVAVHPMKNWAYFIKNSIEGKKYPCKWIWYMMSINWDGKVNMCHEDFDGKALIGDLTKTKIVDIFNCDAIRELREFFYNGELPSSELCKDCSRLKLDKSWWHTVRIVTMPNGTTKYCEQLPGGVR